MSTDPQRRHHHDVPLRVALLSYFSPSPSALHFFLLTLTLNLVFLDQHITVYCLRSSRNLLRHSSRIGKQESDTCYIVDSRFALPSYSGSDILSFFR